MSDLGLVFESAIIFVQVCSTSNQRTWRDIKSIFPSLFPLCIEIVDINPVTPQGIAVAVLGPHIPQAGVLKDIPWLCHTP